MKKLTWLPFFIYDPLVTLKNNYYQSKRKNALKRLSHQSTRKIIVGASGTQFEGWVPSDQDILNLLSENDWITYFKVNSLDAILAEHVWEHLTSAQAVIAANQCFKFLKPGGYLRIAVPDGYHPDPNYVEGVKPGGSGSGADDHKVLYTYKTLSEIFISAGFEVSLLEYFDEYGGFHYKEWNASDGFIERSKRFDSRNTGESLIYTSIILDAKKPVKQND